MAMNANESRRYADIVGPDIGDVISDESVIVLPVGAVEQHGPHLPMSVDDVIATETTTEVVRRFGGDLDLWQLPSLSISKSNEHAWSPGTLWYSAETMMSVLHDIGRSISTTRAERLVLLNGHGGNTTLLKLTFDHRSVRARDLAIKYLRRNEDAQRQARREARRSSGGAAGARREPRRMPGAGPRSGEALKNY